MINMKWEDPVLICLAERKGVSGADVCSTGDHAPSSDPCNTGYGAGGDCPDGKGPGPSGTACIVFGDSAGLTCYTGNSPG